MPLNIGIAKIEQTSKNEQNRQQHHAANRAAGDLLKRREPPRFGCLFFAHVVSFSPMNPEALYADWATTDESIAGGTTADTSTNNPDRDVTQSESSGWRGATASQAASIAGTMASPSKPRRAR